LFEGKDITEPITLAAKFTTISNDNIPPEIILEIPKFVDTENKILPEIIEDNLNDVTYLLDGLKIDLPTDGLDISNFSDGSYIFTVNANDKIGLATEKSFNFIIDTEPPLLEIKSPKNNTSFSKSLFIDLELTDQNLPKQNKMSFSLPNGEQIKDTMTYSFDTSKLQDGQYQISIFGIDKAGNSIIKDIMFTIDHTTIDKPKISEQAEIDPLLIFVIAIVIAIITGIVFLQRKRKIIQNP
jgi:hypothetical protein